MTKTEPQICLFSKQVMSLDIPRIYEWLKKHKTRKTADCGQTEHLGVFCGAVTGSLWLGGLRIYGEVNFISPSTTYRLWHPGNWGTSKLKWWELQSSQKGTTVLHRTRAGHSRATRNGSDKETFNMEGALMAQLPLLKSHPWLLSSLVTSGSWRKHIQMLATSQVRPFPFSSQLGSNTFYFYPQSISVCLLRKARFLDHKPFPLSISSGQKLPTNALTLMETDTSFIQCGGICYFEDACLGFPFNR